EELRTSARPPAATAGPPARVALWGLALAVAFVVSAAIGAVLHVNLPPARRLAAEALNRALADAFRGTLTLERVQRIGLGGVASADARLRGPDGADVVVARGLEARIHPLALLRSAFGGGALAVHVLDARADDVDVNLDSDEAGTLAIAAAVAPRRPSAGEGRPVRLSLPEVTIARAHVHGRPAGAPSLDVDLTALRGSLEVDPGRVDVAIAHVTLAARGTPGGFDPVGEAEGQVNVPAATGRSPGIRGVFRGTAGGVPLTAEAALDGDRLDATVDAPRVAPDAVRARVPGFPALTIDPAALRVEAHGTLAHLAWRAHAASPETVIDADGELSTGDPLRVGFRVAVRGFDLRGLAAEAPRSSVDFHAEGRVEIGASGVGGPFTVAVQRGVLAGETLPAASFEGTFRVPPPPSSAGTAGPEVAVHGKVLEPGAPTDVDARLRWAARGDGGHGQDLVPVVDLRATSAVARLADVRRLGWTGAGGGRAELAGTLTLAATPSVDASLEAAADGLERGPVHVDHAQLSLRASGPLARPFLRGSLDAAGLGVPRFRFSRAHATLDGPPSRALVAAELEGDGGADVAARATLDLADPSALDAPELSLARGSARLHARADALRAGAERLDVTGAVVEGAGEALAADVRWRPGTLAVRASSKGVDLQVLGSLLGAEDLVHAGRLGLDLNLTVQPDRADGDVRVELENARILRLDGVGATLRAHAEGREVAGSLRAEVTGVGFLDASDAKLRMGGRGALASWTWAQSSGSVRLRGDADLARVTAALPRGSLPVAGLGGRIALEGFVRRGPDDSLPDVTLTVTTAGLTVGPRAGPEDAADGTTLSQRPAWLLSGVDGQVHLRAEAASGFAELAASLSDARGTLLSADAKTGALRYDLLYSSPARALEIARDVPFDALVVVPRRAVEGWPGLVRPGAARGEVEARASISGTLRKPSVAVDAAAHGLRFEGAPASPRMEITCGARYDGEVADARLDVTADRADLAHASMRLKARADDLWGAPVSRWPWSASARATLQGWPLGSLAALSGQRVRGSVSGSLEVTGLHEDARATADLQISDLRVAGTKYGAGTATLGLDGRSLRAKLHVGEAPTAVDAEAELATTWGARIAPAIDPSGGLQARLRASKLRAAALAPLLPASVVDELDGNIDIDARFARAAGGPPELAGSATLSDGVLQLTALGQELRDVRGKLTISPSGVVKLEDVSASGTTGRIHGSGAAELEGLTLVAAGAAFTVDQSNALPIDVQGAPIGDVYGQFALRLAPASAARPFTLLDLSVPALHLKMPETSTRGLQELGEAPPEEHVGVFTAPGRFTRLPMSGAERRPPATPEDTRS
ncbi:MAG: hypothetical protein JOZ69_24310, partial [Myxococcales bacterium]|nr:hypothetical protein [Myxococcales bacterium]